MEIYQNTQDLNTDQTTDLDTDVLETIPEVLDVENIAGDLPGTIQDILNTDQLTDTLDTDVLETIPEVLDVESCWRFTRNYSR